MGWCLAAPELETWAHVTGLRGSKHCARRMAASPSATAAALWLMHLEGFSLVSSALAVLMACTGAAKCFGLVVG